MTLSLQVVAGGSGRVVACLVSNCYLCVGVGIDGGAVGGGGGKRCFKCNNKSESGFVNKLMIK